MMTSADNIAVKALLPHPHTNHPYEPLPLYINSHPQEERIDSLENQGISSSQKLTKFVLNAARTAATATATTSQPAAAVHASR